MKTPRSLVSFWFAILCLTLSHKASADPGRGHPAKLNGFGLDWSQSWSNHYSASLDLDGSGPSLYPNFVELRSGSKVSTGFGGRSSKSAHAFRPSHIYRVYTSGVPSVGFESSAPAYQPEIRYLTYDSHLLAIFARTGATLDASSNQSGLTTASGATWDSGLELNYGASAKHAYCGLNYAQSYLGTFSSTEQNTVVVNCGYAWGF